jgi:hypothetical protein
MLAEVAVSEDDCSFLSINDLHQRASDKMPAPLHDPPGEE